jgi:uncharacterized protein with WD repeat
VLATVGSSSKSELEFWDLDFHAEDTGKRDGQGSKDDWGSGIQLLGSADHYGVTDVEWDPSGRYLATSASAWTHTVRDSKIENSSTEPEYPTVGKRLCDLGLPRTRTDEANSGSL